jgi:hypothetical protein
MAAQAASTPLHAPPASHNSKLNRKTKPAPQSTWAPVRGGNKLLLLLLWLLLLHVFLR